MKRIITMLPFSLLVITLSAHAEIDVSKLVKVTGDQDQQCVEYVTYNNEAYCSLTPISVKPPDPNIYKLEKQDIKFDHRPWQAAWSKKDDNIIMIEYVPMGDNINSWTELVTSQFFPGLQDRVTPRNLALGQMDKLREQGFKPIVNFIEETPNQVIFEYRIELPANQQQDELQRITKGVDGLYVLHYVIKKSDMGDESRKQWLQRLKESKIKSQPE